MDVLLRWSKERNPEATLRKNGEGLYAQVVALAMGMCLNLLTPLPLNEKRQNLASPH